jgi:hypothetical protein
LAAAAAAAAAGRLGRGMSSLAPDVVCYICQLSSIPGKFNPQKAAELGVPRGPVSTDESNSHNNGCNNSWNTSCVWYLHCTGSSCDLQASQHVSCSLRIGLYSSSPVEVASVCVM